MKGEAVAIIPARYDSERLPGKALLPLKKIPLVVHVFKRAEQARLVSRTFVATDDDRIEKAVRTHGGAVIRTSRSARSGTDRVAEAAASVEADIIVNVQGDEPLIDPATIDSAIEPLINDTSIKMSTTSEPIDSVEDVLNPNVVKVVTDSQGFAAYFSRSPIPYIRPSGGATLREWLEKTPALLANYRKHSGLYVYRREYLLEFAGMEPATLEQLEALEQLRALQSGCRIRVVNVNHRSIGVDTMQDYEKVKRMIEETI